MSFFIGALLALAVGVFATRVGLDRDRAFYPTAMIVIASYYILFAVMGGSSQSLLAECAVAAPFVVAATLGFRKSLWLVVAALAAHGIQDFFHLHVVPNPGVPAWWPAFCGAYDVVAAAYLGVTLWSENVVDESPLVTVSERNAAMQACTYEEYGSADVVKVSEVDKPGIEADELLVQVRAASVTTADWRFRASEFPRAFWLPGRLMAGLFRPRNPILGMDFSGVVEAVGSKVTRFRVGDAVFGSTDAMQRGAHAQYVAVPESAAIVHKPASLSDEQAAAVPFGANSALAFLRDVADLRAGQRVLIVGASGGVGVWAVQLARHLGAEVTAVCSARNAELVRSLGAHHVIDYQASNGVGANGDEQYDLIFDTIGVTSYADCKGALTEQGTYLPLNSELREIMQALLTSRSSGKRVKSAVSSNTREALEHVVGLIEAGVLQPVVDRVYPMQDIAEAHRHVEGRHKRGSVIVRMATATAA
jgi:NADPH:quinone reductase-like Zn-dependent oxidoreductase